MTNKPDMMLWLSDNRGVYIPRDFASSFIDRAEHVTGVSEEDWKILEAGPDAGPDNESYWDTWTDVCDNAIITDENGVKYALWQDGDLWLIPVGMEWDDKEASFKWPEENEEEETGENYDTH